jgi:hypothetical protein
VQLLGHLAHVLQQARFDMHVDVFQAVVELEVVMIQVAFDAPQAFHQLVGFLVGDHAHFGQHAAMGHAAFDVIGVEALIDLNGGGECLHAGVRALGKAAIPGLFAHGVILILVSSFFECAAAGR